MKPIQEEGFHDNLFEANQPSYQHIMLSIAIIGLCVLLIYLIWRSCCADDSDKFKDNFRDEIRQQPIQPVLFAQEIDPGIVVLQNQDGEIFRILYEYDALKNNLPRTSPTPGQISTLQFIPQYTRVHYQNKPSAPPFIPEQNSNLLNLNITEHDQSVSSFPPIYSRN